MTSSLIQKAIFLFTGVLAFSVLTPPAFGHYLWVGHEEQGYIIARGPSQSVLLPYQTAAVTFIKAIDREGAELPIERVNEKDRVFFRAASPPYLAAVRCDWGGRVNTTQGKKLMTKQEAEQQGFKVLESFNSIHTSKTVFKDGAVVCEPLGMVFEFVPVKSPFALGSGEPLPLKLIFGAEPLKNAMVFWGDDSHTKTDMHGIARIPLIHKGWYLITAKHIVPTAEAAGIDYYQWMTFFVFEVK